MSSNLFPVTIDGTDYMVEPEEFRRSTLQVAREQADTSEEFGEQSLTEQDLWRRAQDDWRLGAGQIWEDKTNLDLSERRRFNWSRGIDPWERGQLSCLPDVESMGTSNYGTLVPVGDTLYMVDESGSNSIHYTTNGSSWSTTSSFDYTVRSIATDGSHLYVAARNSSASSGGVYILDSPTSSPTLINDIIPDKVAYVKGRLMVAAGPDLYNITDLTTTDPPDALTTEAVNEDWEWTCFGESGAHILIGGQSGDLSLIYRISIREDGTALGAPTVAAPLPIGERIRDIEGYVGFVVLATTTGLRVGDESGSIQYGPPIEVGEVNELQPSGSFMYFTYTDPIDGYTGLGRADMGQFLPERPLTPAYATDLLIDSSGEVLSVTMWDGKPVFSVDGQGVFTEGDGCEDGVIRSGKITYTLPEKKMFRFMQIRCDPLESGQEVRWRVFVDGSQVASGAIDQEGATGTDPEGKIESSGDYAEVELELIGGPTVHRWTMRAYPVPRRGRQFVLPLVIRRKVQAMNGRIFHYRPQEEIDHLESLVQADEPVTFRLFNKDMDGFVWGVEHSNDIQLLPQADGVEGTIFVAVRVFDDG